MNRFFPPSRPRAVDGGLVTRSKRGAMVQQWWSARFVAVLDSMGLGSRLQRGRTYARKGQVISMEITPGAVTAVVQGSRARPYRVRIGVTAFGKAEWTQVEQALAADAWYVAKLLAGEMPQDIEDVFGRFGLALFPADSRDLTMDCSCPDWEVPCKHLAATFYLLAESFDEDPFRILTWRGRGRDDLLGNLQAARSERRPVPDGPAGIPLEDCLDRFFLPLTAAPPARVRPPVSGALVIDQVPPISVQVRGVPLAGVVRPAYPAAPSGR